MAKDIRTEFFRQDNRMDMILIQLIEILGFDLGSSRDL